MCMFSLASSALENQVSPANIQQKVSILMKLLVNATPTPHQCATSFVLCIFFKVMLYYFKISLCLCPRRRLRLSGFSQI